MKVLNIFIYIGLLQSVSAVNRTDTDVSPSSENIVRGIVERRLGRNFCGDGKCRASETCTGANSCPVDCCTFDPFLKVCDGTETACSSDGDCSSSSSGHCSHNHKLCSADTDCRKGKSMHTCIFSDNIFQGKCSYAYHVTAAESPDQSKPVKVFILMGQSNMVGFGQVEDGNTPGTLRALVNEGKYPHLLGQDGQWITRQDVFAAYRWGQNGWEESLTVGAGASNSFIGPELQFGHVMGHVLEDPVLILKVGTGNRALGWDFLPPGSTRYEFGGKSYPGHGGCPQASMSFSNGGFESDDTSVYCSTDKNDPGGCLYKLDTSRRTNCPVWWSDKTLCNEQCFGWYAGKQYDMDIIDAKTVLEDPTLANYPGYQGQGFEVAGFVFWQGLRDSYTAAHAQKYGENLQRFIEQVRSAYADYGGETAKFVLATVAFGGCATFINSNLEMIYNAQLGVSGAFDGSVKTVDARSFWRDYMVNGEQVSPANGKDHYNNNAETYMEVGNALGWAMADLLLDSNQLVEEHCV